MISEDLLNVLPTFKTSKDSTTDMASYIYDDPDFMPFTKLQDQASFFAMADVLAGIGLDSQSQLGLVCHPLNEPSRLHYHDYLEICYVAKGRLIQIINQEPLIMTEGDISIIPPKTEHLLAPLEKDQILVIDFLLHPDLLALISTISLSSDFMTIAEHFTRQELEAKQPDFERALEQFLLSYINQDFQSDLSVIGNFLQVLHHLSQKKTTISNPNRDKLTAQCLDLISYHKGNISQAQLATELSYHANYLSRHIKKTTGQTISQLLLAEKLRLAKDLLATSDLPIATIADQIGYASESHFFRIFKENYHITPNHYRQLMRR
ncbi:AraC family transcriptional regulator [Streptococcus caprae]|uniref:AraC family transcriptional regulator n=1 Tax=Streptococcus caprae TaxID=1640501 RepID=A0ABV8CYC2_9STRE